MSYQIRAINRADDEITLTFDYASSPDEALSQFQHDEERLQELRPDLTFPRVLKILSVKEVQ